MPLYYFHCDKCEKPYRKILDADAAEKEQTCKCGNALRRTPKPLTMNVVEVLDNGIMARRVERVADAERIMKERSQKQDE